MADFPEREPFVLNSSLVGDHDEEEDEQGGDAPGGSTGPVDVVLGVGQGDGEGRVIGGEPVEGEQEDDRAGEDEKPELEIQVVEHGLVVDVPGEAQEEEEDHEEEAQLEWWRRQVLGVGAVPTTVSRH
ncbi:hypothetical protein Dimus_011660 [Dionaea muscipula]